MNDLETRQDIELLVKKFYQKVRSDDKIGLFFNDIGKVNWNEHLPKMYSFWESILFGQMSYKGNPMRVHFPINDIKAIEKEHFEHWIKLWTDTVSENFSGKTADLAIYKANNIASLMAYKMEMARKLR
ncbi:group III truncated hemoglobin [Elizabethkingia meningoseptica]|uniref:group III truncated hemoglobin n=1 Tax=Elizabethkingia meningoseptica TaxID=238 RepID=UPI0023AEFA94|nr:group III truncated hemoglobin [Elizabethkingia meningoseptica]MDE5469776.1 group III truncated hemoglobin [Elizabethkingia meningoseptica]MDE5476694.1 group III truncated hemoglobin [Elizabethkingia meningoseptica]MDE5479949.1 group III truncated hemoglobin [Elizabethkingia meningoseptica]MDE5487014.1 group III truncated hemoglobin [Elizabethkingia meningoseptica]MDE5503280.1 group III truncated hemoglobin [Elizabethkingia meningoseptica]